MRMQLSLFHVLVRIVVRGVSGAGWSYSSRAQFPKLQSLVDLSYSRLPFNKQQVVIYIPLRSYAFSNTDVLSPIVR